MVQGMGVMIPQTSTADGGRQVPRRPRHPTAAMEAMVQEGMILHLAV